jgi:excisionase family DNA binding protein
MRAIEQTLAGESAREAKAALRELAPFAASKSTRRGVRLHLEGPRPTQSITVPRRAFELLLEILGRMATGNDVAILPISAELTTQQAADLLNVSRPHLIKLLEEKALPYRRVGTHRRMLAADVLSYKERDDSRRREILDELTADAQRDNLGY